MGKGVVYLHFRNFFFVTLVFSALGVAINLAFGDGFQIKSIFNIYGISVCDPNSTGFLFFYQTLASQMLFVISVVLNIGFFILKPISVLETLPAWRVPSVKMLFAFLASIFFFVMYYFSVWNYGHRCHKSYGGEVINYLVYTIGMNVFNLFCFLVIFYGLCLIVRLKDAFK